MNPGPAVRYLPAFLGNQEGQVFLERLWADLPWTQKDIVLFGRPVRQPRLTAYLGDTGANYRYSGVNWEPAPWHPRLRDLRDRLKAELGLEFNSVLANAYRDGSDAMGWHADDEPELGREPVIASISLGASRRFRMRSRTSKQGRRKTRDIELEHGSLLIMDRGVQSAWQHCVPRTARPCGLRLNLTYRRILPETRL